MKKRLFSLIVIMAGTVLFGGCSPTSTAQRVIGAGERVSQTTQTNFFTGVTLVGNGVVNFHQSTESSVSVEMYENLFDYLEIEVRNGVLYIGFRSGISIQLGDQGKRIDVFAPTLESLTVDGAFTTGHWDVIEAEGFRIDISGAGSFYFNMEAEFFEANIVGAATVTLSGTANIANINVTGIGRANAANLQTVTANVDLIGEGAVEIAVSDNLDASVTGMGTVLYIGNPVVTRNIVGPGTVVGRND